MNKKIKNLFLAGALVLGLAGVAVSCTDYDSDIDALQKQINTLDQTVKGYDVPTLASTVDRLQKAIDGGAVITKVTPIAATATNPGGYEVTLSNGDKYVISNGAKGAAGEKGDSPYIKNGNWWIGNTDTGVKAQGANGENGQTPYIGANGNWFIGETDTQVKAQGADGKDGQTPYIGENGNWFIGETDTKVKAQGADGKDGQTPYIGENGNWFIGETDTEVKAQGADGKSPVITIGENGNWFIDGVDTEKPARGAAGSDGADGANAPIVWYTPDVENNVWVKNTIAADAEDYPNGPVVTEATDIEVVPDLEEKIAAVLSDQTLTFYITDENGDKQTAVINLAPALKGLAFVPKYIFDGLGLITVWEFYAPQNNKAFPFVSVDAGTAEPTFITTAPAEVTYRMDASNVDIDKYDWDFINRIVFTRAIADETDLVSIVEGPVKDAKDGSLIDFKIQLNKAVEPAGHRKKNDIVALRAIDGEGEPVVSDYAYIDNRANFGYTLIHKDGYTQGQPKPYRTDFVKIGDPAEADGVNSNPKTPVLRFDDADGIDLLDYVETFANQVNDLVSTTGLEPTYKFFFAGYNGVLGPNDQIDNKKVIIDADPKKATYLTADQDKTNQNEFVTLEGSIVKVNSEFVSALRPAIGRTPLIYAQACYGDYILAEGFIKIKITEDEIEAKPTYKVFIKHAAEFDIDDLAEPTYKGTKYLDYPDDNYELNVVWAEMNVKMFNELGMSYAQFLENYDTRNLRIIVAKDKTGKTVEPGDLPDEGEFEPKATMSYGAINDLYGPGHNTFFATPGNPAQNTNMVSLSLDDEIAVGGPHYVYVLYPSKNPLYPNAVVKFVYNVKEHVHDFSIGSWLLNPDYILGNQNALNPADPKDYTKSYAPYDKDNKGYGAVRIKGQGTLMQSGLIEHFEEYSVKVNEESVYTFLIKNYTTDEVIWVADELGTVKDTTIKVGDKNEVHSKVTLTGAELKQVIDAPTKTPFIKLTDQARITKGYDVLVEVTEACATPEHIVTGAKSQLGYYFVVFKALDAKLALKDVKLGTFKEINDYVLVTELVEGIYDGTTLLFTLDPATGEIIPEDAAAEYGMDATQVTITLEPNLLYNFDTKASFGDNLYVVPAGQPYDPTQVEADVDGINWWNLGTDLQKDKKAEYKVTVKYGDDVLVEGTGLITVLATANSIHPLHNEDGELQEPIHNKDGEIYAIAEPETTEGEGETQP